MSTTQTLSQSHESGRAAIVRELDKSLDAVYGGTFEETLHVCALQIRLLLGVHMSAVSYLPDWNFKNAIHTHSFSKEYEKYNSYNVMPTGDGIWGLIIARDESILMSDKELKSHPKWENFSDVKDDRGLEHPPMRGWLAVPVRRLNHDITGVLQVTDKIVGDFRQRDRLKLESFGRVVGMAFDLHYANNELNKKIKEQAELEQELLQISDREQNRIGSDLHDGICQQLSGTEFLLKVLVEKIHRGVRIKNSDLQEVQSFIGEAMKQSRSLARGLTPFLIESDGLASAIIEHLNIIQSQYNVSCPFHSEDFSDQEDLKTNVQLFRIFQEAVSNSIKHGKAKNIAITLSSDEKTLLLCIHDDGDGFESKAVSKRGMGLNILRYRAQDIGGEIIIRSTKNLGTEVACIIAR